MNNSKKRIILATNNLHKVDEIKTILRGINVDIFSLSDLSIDVDPIESSDTFEGNAYIKSKSVYDYMVSNMIFKEDDIIVADDSGFCIDFFNGEPGVKSSRFLGKDTSYNEKFEYILDKMKNVKLEDRTCYFITCICMITKNDTKYFYGKIDGKVSEKVIGKEGFGYDPIFYIDEYKTTIADIGQEVKNRISHRKKALNELCNYLKTYE